MTQSHYSNGSSGLAPHYPPCEQLLTVVVGARVVVVVSLARRRAPAIHPASSCLWWQLGVLSLCGHGGVVVVVIIMVVMVVVIRVVWSLLLSTLLN